MSALHALGRHGHGVVGRSAISADGPLRRARLPLLARAAAQHEGERVVAADCAGQDALHEAVGEAGS